MGPVQIRDAAGASTDAVAAAWRSIAAVLEKERDRIQQEIRNTPPPIPACDANVNYLLERRAQISGELDRVHRAEMESVAPEEALERIEDFIRSSSCLDDEARRAIRAGLSKRLTQVRA